MKNLRINIFILTGLTAFFMLSSCSKSKKHIKLKITLECTPAIYFDSLTNVLLSNDYTLFGSKKELEAILVDKLLSPGTVYVKNLKRNPSNAFVLEDVEKGRYEYLLIEGYVTGSLFTGYIHKLDFRHSLDTAVVSICIQANARAVPN